MSNRFVCGTRAVVEGPSPNTWRVVCATCDGGGSVLHTLKNAAHSAAVRDSANPCPARPSCGAK